MGFKNLKNKFEERKQEQDGSKSNVIYLKPDEKHYVRLVPRKLSEDEESHKDAWLNQFKHALVHYSSNKVVPRTTFSPANWGESDILEDFCNDTLHERRVDKEEFKFLVNLKPNDCYIVPALVRGKEEEGVKLFVMSQYQYESFLDTLENTFLPDEPPEIWNPKSGHDLIVEVKSKEKTGKKYGQTTITIMSKSTPLNNDDLSVEEAKELISEQPTWDEAYQQKSNDELHSYLKNYLQNGADASGSADAYDEEVDDSGDEWGDAFGASDDVDQEEVNSALEEFKSKQTENLQKEAPESSGESEEEMDEEEELNPFEEEVA